MNRNGAVTIERRRVRRAERASSIVEDDRVRRSQRFYHEDGDPSRRSFNAEGHECRLDRVGTVRPRAMVVERTA
jgi:hypothetical protein